MTSVRSERRYAVASGPQNSFGSFEIAFCHSCKLCPTVYNASFHPGAGCPNCTKPVHPPPPPPPLSTNPCIRFGHAIPVDNHVDAMIVQDSDPSISHTCKCTSNTQLLASPSCPCKGSL